MDDDLLLNTRNASISVKLTKFENNLADHEYADLLVGGTEQFFPPGYKLPNTEGILRYLSWEGISSPQICQEN